MLCLSMGAHKLFPLERLRIDGIKTAHLPDIERQQNRVRKDPGRRICKAHGVEAELSDKPKGYDCARNQLRDASHHGLPGKAHSL